MLGIKMENVTLRYGHAKVLDDVSFQLEGGKIYGLIGRNGAGKTSLLSLLASYMKQNAGTISIDGVPAFENAEMMRQVCCIQEQGFMSESYKVKEVLNFSAQCWPNWDAAYANRLINHYELPMKKSLHQLSRGMRSALGVTIGLASRAPVTLLDEVYLGMDAPSRYYFYDELLRDYMDHKRTIIISTHLIEEVSNLFEEILIVDQGKLLLHKTVDDLQQDGCTVTGNTKQVNTFGAGLNILNEQGLGNTKSITVYGGLTAEKITEANELGLVIGQVSLQDLFVHLTKKGGGEDA